MLVIAIAIFVGAGFYRTAKNYGLNALVYGILGAVICYFSFKGMRTGLPYIFESVGDGGKILFSAIGSLMTCMILFIILDSSGKAKQRQENNNSEEE